jgi:hypothetical protein
MEAVEILRVLFLLTVANGAPVLARDVFGMHLSSPLDGGARFLDGRPLFGTSKTFRGIVISIATTAIGAKLTGLGWQAGMLVGSAAMAGDLFSSFVKRRLNLPSGTRATGLDQLPECVLPLLICWKSLSVTVFDAIVIAGLFMFGEIVISPLLYKVHLRERPY